MLIVVPLGPSALILISSKLFKKSICDSADKSISEYSLVSPANLFIGCASSAFTLCMLEEAKPASTGSISISVSAAF